MNLERLLAKGMLEAHPEEAAAVLETLPGEAAAALLSEISPGVAAQTMRRLVGHSVPGVTDHMSPETLASIIGELDAAEGARILRRVRRDMRARLLDSLPQRRARSLRARLSHPEETAGALMDPDVLGLSDELTVKEAVERVRRNPEHARYNLYVTDREHRLVGVLNLRELLLAAPRMLLRNAMKPATHRLSARAQPREIVEHPGWRSVHALPVVDGRDIYLGAVRYGTLRRLEGELHGRIKESDPTAQALGELFSTGAAAVVETLTGAPRWPQGGSDA